VTRSASDLPDGNRTNQRPDLVPGVSIYPAGGSTIFKWFNPMAFKVPAKGTWGNAGRFIGRSPGYWEMDTALEKRTPLTERVSVSFRTEAFNLFNHPIYANPGSNISASSTFGRITGILNNGAVGTGAPRRWTFERRRLPNRSQGASRLTRRRDAASVDTLGCGWIVNGITNWSYRSCL